MKLTSPLNRKKSYFYTITSIFRQFWEPFFRFLMTICRTKTFKMIICELIRSISMLFRSNKLIFLEIKKVRNRVYLALIPWKSTFGQYYYQPCHLHPIWVFAQKVQICCQKIHEWSQSGAREQILNFDVSLKMLPLRKQKPMLINKLYLIISKEVDWSRNHQKLRLKLDISE